MNGKHNILGENLQKIKSSRKDWCGRAPKTCLDGEIFAVASVLAPGTLSEERRGWICSHRAVGQQQQGIQSPLWWAELIPLFPSDFWHLRYSCYFCLVGCRTQCFCLPPRDKPKISPVVNHKLPVLLKTCQKQIISLIHTNQLYLWLNPHWKCKYWQRIAHIQISLDFCERSEQKCLYFES